MAKFIIQEEVKQTILSLNNALYEITDGGQNVNAQRYDKTVRSLEDVPPADSEVGGLAESINISKWKNFFLLICLFPLLLALTTLLVSLRCSVHTIQVCL